MIWMSFLNFVKAITLPYFLDDFGYPSAGATSTIPAGVNMLDIYQ